MMLGVRAVNHTRITSTGNAMQCASAKGKSQDCCQDLAMNYARQNLLCKDHNFGDSSLSVEMTDGHHTLHRRCAGLTNLWSGTKHDFSDCTLSSRLFPGRIEAWEERT